MDKKLLMKEEQLIVCILTLEFHPNKCVKMSINNKECENRNYKMNDITLRNVKQEKILE